MFACFHFVLLEYVLDAVSLVCVCFGGILVVLDTVSSWISLGRGAMATLKGDGSDLRHDLHCSFQLVELAAPIEGIMHTVGGSSDARPTQDLTGVVLVLVHFRDGKHHTRLFFLSRCADVRAVLSVGLPVDAQLLSLIHVVPCDGGVHRL